MFYSLLLVLSMRASTLHLSDGFWGVCRQNEGSPVFLDHHIVLDPHPKTPESLWTVVLADVLSWVKGARDESLELFCSTAQMLRSWMLLWPVCWSPTVFTMHSRYISVVYQYYYPYFSNMVLYECPQQVQFLKQLFWDAKCKTRLDRSKSVYTSNAQSSVLEHAFRSLTSRSNFSPATVFCIYSDWLNENIYLKKC